MSPAELPPIGTRWGDIDKETRARLPAGMALGAEGDEKIHLGHGGLWTYGIEEPADDLVVVSYPGPKRERQEPIRRLLGRSFLKSPHPLATAVLDAYQRSRGFAALRQRVMARCAEDEVPEDLAELALVETGVEADLAAAAEAWEAAGCPRTCEDAS